MSKRKLLLANNPLLSGPKLEDREKNTIPYREIPLSAIERDPNQPRITFDEDRLQELCDSIKTYGVMSPIIVRPTAIPGKYRLVAGERRLRASKLAGLTSIPAMVDRAGVNDSAERTLAIQLVENLQRADLTPLERAQAIGALRDSYQLSIRDIAEKLGVSKSMVQRSLELLELPDDLLQALKNGAAESKVLILSKIEDPEIRASYLNDLDTLTRDQLKKDVDARKEEISDSVNDKVKSILSPEDLRISEELQRSLGLKVRLFRNSQSSEGGRVTIEFYSESDLQDLFRRLVA
jgi:ParB family chromosome partitioning protein